MFVHKAERNEPQRTESSSSAAAASLNTFNSKFPRQSSKSGKAGPHSCIGMRGEGGLNSGETMQGAYPLRLYRIIQHDWKCGQILNMKPEQK